MRQVGIVLLALTAAMLLWACGGGGPSPTTPLPTASSPEASPSPIGPIACSLDLAKEQPDSVIYGAEAGDFLADRFALASGDFNGDGLDDLLIGAPLADGPGNSRTSAGEAYVILSATSPEPVVDLAESGADLTVIGENADDNLGFAVASGDINGDGKDDVIVGARFATVEGRADAGKVYVVFGGDDLGATIDTSEGEQDLTISGQDSGDFMGIALGSGDLNGDGIDDLILGASAADGPNDDRDNAGAVYVVLGSRHLPKEIDLGEDTLFFTVHGDRKNDSLPNTVASGDLNDDAKDELILGAPFAESGDVDREGAGEAYIIDVPDGGGILDLASAQGFTRISGADLRDGFGFYVAAGDVNGDGSADAIIGARNADGRPGEERDNAGEVHVLFGAPLLPDRVALREELLDATIYGISAADSLGFTVAAGDLDGDGSQEVLAGAPLGDGCQDALPDAGEFYVVAGGSDLTGEILLTRGQFQLSVYGTEGGDSLAFSLITGDVNGDGKDDIIVGALLADGPENSREDAGEAYVIISR